MRASCVGQRGGFDVQWSTTENQPLFRNDTLGDIQQRGIVVARNKDLVLLTPVEQCHVHPLRSRSGLSEAGFIGIDPSVLGWQDWMSRSGAFLDVREDA